MKDTRTDFSKKVIALIKAIPEGKVATYGLIAKLAGKPNGSRGVGWLLHSSSGAYELPWQRVLKSSGKLSFPEMSSGYVRQKRLLELEGVEVLNGKVDLKTYLWNKQLPKSKTSKTGAKNSLRKKSEIKK